MPGSNSLSSFVVFSICPFDCNADIFTDNCRDCFYSFKFWAIRLRRWPFH